MAKTPNRVSKRLRRTTKKFGIDDYIEVEKCVKRTPKRVVIDLISNCSNDCQQSDHSDQQNKSNLRSKQSKLSINLLNLNQSSNELKTKTLSKLRPIRRQLQESNELSDKSNNSRTLRSKRTKTIETNEQMFGNIDKIETKFGENSVKTRNNSVIDKSLKKSFKTKEIKINIENQIKPKKQSVMTPKTPKLNDKNKNWLEMALKRLSSNAIPDSLPCRESQFKDIFNYVESKLMEGNGGCMYISGVPGTGKTATVHEVRRELESSHKYPNFKFIEINGLKLSDPFQTYVQILYELTGEKRSSYHSADALNERFSNCDSNNEFVILLVDELDLLRTRKQNILYHLFDWPTRPNSKLIVLAIANSMDLPEKLMINRVSSRLGLTRLSFHPYSYRELEAIISSRLEGLPEVFDFDALQLICRKVAAVSGDARRALDICRLSVEMAQMTDEKTVSMDSVNSALQEIFNSMKMIRIRSASLQEKLFLQSIVQEFRISGVEESNFIDIFRHHIEMCHFEGHYTPSAVELEKIAYNLQTSRLIILENSGSHLFKRLRLNVSVDDINFALKM